MLRDFSESLSLPACGGSSSLPVVFYKGISSLAPSYAIWSTPVLLLAQVVVGYLFYYECLKATLLPTLALF